MDSTTGGNHIINQFAAGVIFGVAAGFFSNRNLFAVTNCISGALVVATLLDHLGYMFVPWCWHGPGSEPDRFKLTLSDITYEMFIFCLNNFIVFVVFIVVYQITVGRIPIARGQGQQAA